MADSEFLEKALAGRPKVDLRTIRRRIQAILRDSYMPDPWNPFQEAELGLIRVQPGFENSTPQRIEAFPVGAEFSADGRSDSKRLTFIVAGDHVYRSPWWAEAVSWDVYRFNRDTIVGKESLSEFALSFVTDSEAHLVRIMGHKEARLWQAGDLAAIKAIGQAGRNVLHFNVGTQLWRTEMDKARFDAVIPLSTLREWVAKKWLKVGWHVGSHDHGALPGIEIAITMDALDELAPLLHMVGNPTLARFDVGMHMRVKTGPQQGRQAWILSVVQVQPKIRYQIMVPDAETLIEADESDLEPF